MPVFEVTCKRRSGVAKELIFATSMEHIIDECRQRNEVPLYVRLYCVSARSLFFMRRQTTSLLQSLHDLLSSGIQLSQALSMLSGMHRGYLGSWAQVLAQGLTFGITFDRLLEQIPLVDEFEKNVIAAAYEHGKLLEALEMVLRCRKEQALLRAQFIRLAAMPCIGIGFILIFIGIFVLVILPSIYGSVTGMQLRFNPDQQIFMERIKYLSENGLLIVTSSGFLVILALVVLILSIKRSWGYKLVSVVPIISKVLGGRDLFLVASSLRVLVASGVPLDKSILLVAKIGRLHTLHQQMQHIHMQLMHGITFDQAVLGSTFARLFPEIIPMIQVGLNSGRLDKAFENIENYAYQKTTITISRLQVLVQPLLLFIAGLIIVFFIKNLYLPLLMIPLESASLIGG